jgi:hypothetical protein
VSIQATDNQPCASWKGLLHDGARQCAELDASLRDKWLARVNKDIDSGDLDDMLSAAEKITSVWPPTAANLWRRSRHWTRP